MSVHQLKDGRWVVRYRKGANPHDVHRTIEYFGRGKDAEGEAKARDAEMIRKKRRDNMSPLFSVLADDYLLAGAATISLTDRMALYYKLKSVLGPVFGGMMAGEITHRAIDAFVAARMKAGRKKTTIHRELSYLRAILNWAVSRKYIAASPFTGYRMPKRDDAFIVPPTQEEFDSILHHAAPHIRKAMLVSFYTGLRPGAVELFSLRWSAVDLAAGTLTVISADKGGIPLRVVPLHPILEKAMTVWSEEDQKEGIEYIIHYKGRPIKTSIKTAWRAAKKRAGVTKKLTPYSIRHKTISDMAANGADIKTVAELVGHADASMTMRIYQQTTSAMKKSAIGLLGATSECCTSEKKE